MTATALLHGPGTASDWCRVDVYKNWIRFLNNTQVDAIFFQNDCDAFSLGVGPRMLRTLMEPRGRIDVVPRLVKMTRMLIYKRL